MSNTRQDELSGTSDGDLSRRREVIRRGLARSTTATGVALLIIIGLALTAVFYALEARRSAAAARAANRRTTETLWQSRLTEATALRLSGKVGRRGEGMQAIHDAVDLRPAPELRDAALATLALVDLAPGAFWQPTPAGIVAVGCGPRLEHYAWGDGQGRVEIFRAADRRAVGQFALTNRLVMSLDFSPDGRFLAARFLEGGLRVWDVARAKLVLGTHAPTDGFNEHTVVFHPREPFLLASSARGPIRVFDTRTWRETAPVTVTGRLAAHGFDRTGQQLAVAVDARVELWDFAERRCLETLDAGGAMTAVAWHPNEQLLAAAHSDGNLTLLDRRTGRRRTLAGHTMVATRVQFDPRGEVLVSTSWDGTTRFWDAGTGRALLVSEGGYALAFDAAGERLFYHKEGQGVGSWRFVSATGFSRLAVPVGLSERVLTVDFSPDGDWLAGTTREAVLLWHHASRNGAGFAPLADAQGVAFAADGQSLVATSSRGLHRIPIRSDPATGERFLGEPALVSGTEGRAFWLGFATHGANGWLAAATLDAVAVVPLREPDRFRWVDWRGPRRSAAVSPTGDWLAVSTWKGGGTHVWDLRAGRPAASLDDEGGLAAFSLDGQWLAVGTSTEFVFYRADDWQLARRVAREAGSALSGVVAFSPVGDWMALTHTVRQARLMSSDGARVLANLHAPQAERITGLAFSRDGGRLAAATDQGEVQLWDLARLRRELTALGLDWGAFPEDAPPAMTAAAPASPSSAVWWTTGLGAGLALVFALYSIRHQRRLVGAYARVEAVATERQHQLEATHAALAHSQKMRALGTLAAGIAHDFNNLLSIIRMAGQLVRRQVRPTGTTRENLDAIEQAVGQGKDIVRSILGYSRQPTGASSVYAVNTAISETLAMLSRQFLGGIVLTLDLDQTNPTGCGDRARLEQILLNLIVNAAEAMQGRGKLWLQVRTRPTAEDCVLSPPAAPRYVEVVVRDSGPGIAPAVLPRVFEPFFTTKQGGAERGIGLGLTTVYTIAQQDGLGLGVDSAPGAGATFRVLIPATASPEGAA